MDIFVTINFKILIDVLSEVALVLLAVIITVFVLTVTLLGRAAEFSKDRKAKTERESSQDFENSILLLREKLKGNTQNVDELEEEIKKLKIKKAYTDEVIAQLDKKYNAIGLRWAVIIPGASFFITILLSRWIILLSENKIWEFIILVVSLFSLCYGVGKIIVTLKSIQEFSLNIPDEQPQQMQTAFTQALRIIDESKEPKPFVIFIEKAPFIFKSNSEAEIFFKIKLQQPGNVEAKNVTVWFFTSPEIEILESPDYKKPFKQIRESALPDNNTVKFNFPLVRIGVITSGIIRIKTTISGEYKLIYKVDCDGHAELISKDKRIGIIVRD
jgi:hypothetical protein